MTKIPALLKVILVVILVLVGALQAVPRLAGAARGASQPPDQTLEPGLSEALQKKLQEAKNIQGGQGLMPAASGYDFAVDAVFYSSDGSSAVIWLAPVDPQSGEKLATEPVLALGSRAQDNTLLPGDQWTVTLEGDPDFSGQQQALPSELSPSINPDFIEDQQSALPQRASSVAAAYGGYKLPWANGLVKHISMGANHTSCPSRCTFAFDFADGTMFPLLASKGGTVYHFNDTCANGNEYCTNSITIEDRSTVPATYQIYLHLQQSSIPPELKRTGAPVLQGQYIGNVDDTGYSTGHHVHFMVVTNPYMSSSGYMWGTSVDITFLDVGINYDPATRGGRPCGYYDLGYGHCSQWQRDYASGNMGTNPPTGELVAPGDRLFLTNPTVMVAGWGADDRAVTRMSMIANYDGAWYEVGPSQTVSPFTFDLDLCAAGIPDGPFDLALRVWDMEGNRSVQPIGVRHMVKDVDCPYVPPACTPTSTQVALFTGENFSGACKLLNAGDYPSFSGLSPLASNSVASVIVGDYAKVTFYDLPGYQGRAETIGLGADPSLADNRNGIRTASSLKVMSHTANLTAPVITPPHGPDGVSAPTARDSLVLTWDSALGATKYAAAVYAGASASGTPVRTTCPVNVVEPCFGLFYSLSLGTLPQGTYTARVTGRYVDYSMNWHTSESIHTFTVGAGALSGAARAMPFEETLQSGGGNWTASGLWRLVADPANSANRVFAFNDGFDISSPGLASGDLTSLPISIPAGGKAYLRFSYRADTESRAEHWDQRWLQVSVNGAPFVNVRQFSGDAANEWLLSPFIDLSAHAGKTIRLRFHFDNLDAAYNAGFAGWMVDNISLTNTPPPSCAEATPNDTTATATQMSYGNNASGVICAPGDVDYYKFSGAKGDFAILDIDARTLATPSPLDATVALIDDDGHTVMIENDDEEPGSNLDPYLGIKLPAAGVYYIRVTAHAHPGVGAPDMAYTLKLRKGIAPPAPALDPVVVLLNPASGYGLSGQPTYVSAAAASSGLDNPIRYIEFYWHGPDWSSGGWNYLGTDWNGADSWRAYFDTSALPEGQPVSVIAIAADLAGNTSVALNWAAPIDRTSPALSLQAPAGAGDGTLVRLTWQVSEQSASIDFFQLQYNRDGAGWQDANPALLPPSTRVFWFVGERGHNYEFRMRAVDTAGNASPFSLARASIGLTACPPDAYEAGAGDSTRAAAVELKPGVLQQHNFCDTGDQDWTRVNLVAGKKYFFQAIPGPESGATPVLTLLKPDGTTVAEYSGQTGGQVVPMIFEARESGWYTLNIHSLDPRAVGSLTGYQSLYFEAKIYWLPEINR